MKYYLYLVLLILVSFIFSSCDNRDDVTISPIFIDDLNVSKWPYNYESALSFIWDDNNEDHYLTIAPLFDLYNFKASFGVITSQFQLYEENNPDIYGYQHILSNGHEIMSHSHSHLPVEQLNNDQIIFELSESKRLVNYYLNVNPISYVHPNNRTNDFYNTSLSSYYAYSRIFNPSFNEPSDSGENFIANIGPATNYNRFQYIHSLNIQTSNWIVIAGHGVDYYGFAPILSDDLIDFLYDLYIYEKTWVDSFSTIALYNDIRNKVILNYENNIITISGFDLDKYREYFSECILTFNFTAPTENFQIHSSQNPNLLNISSDSENNSHSVTIDLFKGSDIYLMNN
jgi:peptidoglycan/xylan/chitin deacetylase (PgdA/CDA1 family)